MKNPDKVKMGKKSKASGADFERRTRKDLEEKGWIVDKWGNNVEFAEVPNKKPDFENEKGAIYSTHFEGKLIPAKARWAGSGRPMMMGAGFPDFKCHRVFASDVSKKDKPFHMYEVIGVECKVNGKLDKEEKEKCKWLLDNHVFSKILIAYKEQEGRRIVVEYKEFK